MEFLQSSEIAAIDSVAHAFFGRRGGISTGDYSALNGGMLVGDDPAAVVTNRQNMLQALSASTMRLMTLRQLHSNRVQVVSVDDNVAADSIEADALVTGDTGLMLGIATADCAPVLFASPETGVIAAAHAGWRGALAGILPNTLEAMERLGGSCPAAIHAVIGPMIQQSSFEVGDEVRVAFIAQQNDWERFFIPASRRGYYQFDLSALLQAQLEALHVRVDRIAVDTYQNHADYFSYRHSIHQHCVATGRQLALIGRYFDSE